MPPLTNPDPQEDATKEAVIAALLPCLADLLDLAGNAKLAHWNNPRPAVHMVQEAPPEKPGAPRPMAKPAKAPVVRKALQAKASAPRAA